MRGNEMCNGPSSSSFSAVDIRSSVIIIVVHPILIVRKGDDETLLGTVIEQDAKVGHSLTLKSIVHQYGKGVENSKILR